MRVPIMFFAVEKYKNTSKMQRREVVVVVVDEEKFYILRQIQK